ncbi:hypothetical protein [Streptomyces sp. NEAU-S77]|uniref:hypothetical protein n=1 Tax=Streptomyces sp. NEAU-S77 TaxID=3411033 RepID=UPI003BA34212
MNAPTRSTASLRFAGLHSRIEAFAAWASALALRLGREGEVIPDDPVPLEKSSPQVSGMRSVRWDHAYVIVSLLCKVTRKLLTVPSVLLRRGWVKEAELLVLRHENVVLRRQLAGPVRYERADRFWFAALSGVIPRRHWLKIFPVTPGTLLA